MSDIDIVINLAGATLNKRWTKDYKQTLMLSRIQSTQALLNYLKKEKRNQKYYLMPVQWDIILLIITIVIQNF